jgi:hypothetical protein
MPKTCDSSDFPTPYPSEEPGWTWYGITIGSSTEQDLINKLGEPSTRAPWPPSRGKLVACVYRYADLDNFSEFWLTGGKVVAIQIATHDDETRLRGQPATLDELKELYGRADLVGWHPVYGAGHRSVVWTSEGMLAIVFRGEPDDWIGRILYFPPMSHDEFSDSMWSWYVLYTNPTLDTDVIDTLPRDPFDW